MYRTKGPSRQRISWDIYLYLTSHTEKWPLAVTAQKKDIHSLLLETVSTILIAKDQS